MSFMPLTPLRLSTAAALACVVALPAAAQHNIEKLKQMKVAITDLNIPVVPQTGKNADAIKENLKRVKLPPGFKIELFAVVPDARHMAVAPSTNMIATRLSSRWRPIAMSHRRGPGLRSVSRMVCRMGGGSSRGPIPAPAQSRPSPPPDRPR